MQGLVVVEDTEVSCCCESFVCISRDAQLSQIVHLRPGLLPLLPDVHSESASHFAVIDQEVVWYGSTNLLSRDKEDDSLMRICSMDVALELLEEIGR